jgi:hypothetical protein
MLLLFVSVFVSYYTTYAFLAHAEPSGNVKCYRTGTLERTCCQDHIINRGPSNPAGTLVTYCTDCEIGPGGVSQNCGDRYIQAFEQDPNPPATKSPFKERLPSGVIEQSQPLTQQNPNGVNENIPPQQEFTEQLSSSETLEGDNVVENAQNNDFSEQSEENNIEDESNDNEQNNTNS